MATRQGDSVILEEEIDPAYEPSEDEVLEYAKWLGIDTIVDADLLYIVGGLGCAFGKPSTCLLARRTANRIPRFVLA